MCWRNIIYQVGLHSILALCALQSIPMEAESIIIAIINNTGCPSVLRMDRGLENSKIVALQYAMREAHDNYSGPRSVQFGISPANIVCHVL